MDSTLYDNVLERLLDADIDRGAVDLVDAACQGDRALDEALGTLGTRPVPEREPLDAADAPEPPGAYLTRLQVQGFRGIGERVSLDLKSGPGLVLVGGRNGSGKSSLAEGLETLLTGISGRWSERRAKDWKAGWRNLHAPRPVLEAQFVVEGKASLKCRRTWSEGAEVEDSELRVTEAQNADSSLRALGWDGALEAFRPFLSYQELSALLQEPSKAFDKLWGLLGLDELQAAIARLRNRHSTVDKRRKEVNATRKKMVEVLATLEDERAAACLGGLKKKGGADLEAVSAAIAQTRPADDGELSALRGLARLRVPEAEAIEDAMAELEAALATRERLTGELAERHADLASLLDVAVAHVEKHPGASCPVCTAPLSGDFLSDAKERLETSRGLAREVGDAADRVRIARAAVARLFPRIDERAWAAAEMVGGADILRVTSSTYEAVRGGDDVARVLGAAAGLRDALHDVVVKARAELEAREARFRPVAEQIAGWLVEARCVEQDEPARKALKSAMTWLKEAEQSIREARFLPIAEQVAAIWTELGEGSSVRLEQVQLAGAATRRRLDLDVRVDGQPGAAIAVMSQGELNALALSLFLPRMMLAESPFRFLVVDDPVQAMDPVKVDGLARVLARVAERRQVIVLTHDPRLLEAVRRLRIEATVFRVTRRGGSVVEIERSLDPIEDHLSDARTIARDGAALGQDIADRLVPGFCRSALEAACLEAIRRRRLGRGDSHEALQALVDDTLGLMPLTALALFDDPKRGGDVYRRLRNRSLSVDAFKACKEGAHGKVTMDLVDLVRETKKLAHYLREVT